VNPEEFVILALESMGYTPKKIQEGNTESPDFIIETENAKYLIELKTKLDDLIEVKKKRRSSKIRCNL